MQALDASPLSEEAKKNIRIWLNEKKYAFYNDELVELVEHQEWSLLEDAFFRVIPFGTGGRRGTCGIGSNRINRVTIGETIQAFCDYLKNEATRDQPVIAIAHDSRLTSKEFADYCASVASANGVKVYVFDGPRSTPELSFTVREKKLDGGVVITASHNPSSDNGIKLYWSDGGQLVAPHDKNILRLAESVDNIASRQDNALIQILTREADTKYWQAGLSHLFSDDRGARIAYSNLHGTGITSVYPALQGAGFEVSILDEQSAMDGLFPNVTNHIPNPEVPQANDKLAEFALSIDADLATSNDPDADRYCVLVRDRGEMVQLTGNQAGALMTDYVLENLSRQKRLTKDHFVCSTIVTTDMMGAIAKKYGIESVHDLLVGFKYIGEQIKLRQDKGTQQFVCGIEESYGGIVGDYCRDKDAVGPTLVLAELASKLKAEGKTLLDRLDELYKELGVFQEDLYSVTFPGAEGFEQMSTFMDRLRHKSPTELAGFSVTEVIDYLDEKTIRGKSENVIALVLNNDRRNRVTVRPSGTEPKLKVYLQVYETAGNSDLGSKKKLLADRLTDLKSAMIQEIGL